MMWNESKRNSRRKRIQKKPEIGVERKLSF